MEFLFCAGGDDVEILLKTEYVGGRRENLLIVRVQKPGIAYADQRAAVQLLSEKFVGKTVGGETCGFVKGSPLEGICTLFTGSPCLMAYPFFI